MYTNTRTHRGKGVAGESRVIYRCGCSHRGGQRQGAQDGLMVREQKQKLENLFECTMEHPQPFLPDGKVIYVYNTAQVGTSLKTGKNMIWQQVPMCAGPENRTELLIRNISMI